MNLLQLAIGALLALVAGTFTAQYSRLTHFVGITILAVAFGSAFVGPFAQHGNIALGISLAVGFVAWLLGIMLTRRWLFGRSERQRYERGIQH